jgi:predicted esterase
MKPLARLVLAGPMILVGCHDAGVHHTPSKAPASVSATPPVVVSAPVPWPRTKPPSIRTDWCIEGVDAMDEETCWVIPDEPTTTLLVYFHGIVPPTAESQQKTNYQTVVANAARRQRAVALLPKGRQGFAPAGNPGWWGWPTTEAGYREHAKALMDAIAAKRARAADLLGVSFARTYVAGSSSGAYFVAALALHGGIAADGFAVLSGGGGRRTAELQSLEPRPVYIGFGTYDSVRDSARALGEVFRSAGWPVRVSEQALGHGAREIYLQEAFEFFAISRGASPR